MKISILLLPTLLFIFSNVRSQDAHFTQFYVAPLNLNPAMAGTYAGSFRVSMLYRDQWRSALESPLSTFAASGDVKFDINNKKSNNPDRFALGITFGSDRVNLLDANTNQILLSGAFHKSLNKRTKQYLGLGVQSGIIQKSINYENLTFQDQFNAVDGYTLGSSEFLPPNNIAFADLNIGLYYGATPSKKLNYHFGLSYYHMTKPNLSFYNDASILNNDIEKLNVYYPRLAFHGGASVALSYKTEFQPRIIFLSQGQNNTLQLGSNFKYKLTERTGQYLHIGPWIRGVQNENGFGLESIAAMVGIERNNLILGFSYDWGITGFVRDGRNVSTFEISIIYIGEHDNDDNFCPQF